MRRKIYECKACGRGYCTIRTRSNEKPSKCLYWFDYSNWIRIDKHAQKEIDEYE